ncbi:MAG TPA: hypothetical protein VGJ28_16335 [Micromonosporaceae bacterium]
MTRKSPIVTLVVGVLLALLIYILSANSKPPTKPVYAPPVTSVVTR